MTQDLLSIFNDKEREVIESCIASGQYTSVPSALESAGCFDMNPDKERVLELYLASFRPLPEGDSVVQAELDKWLLAGNVIDTPEKEKMWQDKLDAEKAEKRAKMTGEELKKEEELLAAKEVPADDIDELEMTKAEIMDALTAKGVSFKPQQSKAELSALLETANA